MLTGARVTAPDGFEQFQKGVNWHFIGNATKSHRALLVCFEWSGKGQPTSYIHVMDRQKFEAALDAKKLVVSDGIELPPWLMSREGVNFATIETDRAGRKRTYRDIVEARYKYIKPALDNLEEILSARDVAAAINSWAKRSSPRQNETRFRLWFLSYGCFSPASVGPLLCRCPA